jgi:hypothetical protein
MTEPIRSERDVFLRLLFAGQCVDWRHSLVVVLVVTGLFATPLALGSIRNRVYWAVKAQVERENNAREIRLTAQHEEAPPLDAARIAKLEAVSPGLVVVGNHKLMVSVEGPAGRDFLTLEVLFPDDPRSAWLGIAPAVPASFGVGEVVVSDTLGRHLYGNEAWQQAQERLETLTPLTLSINEHPLSGSFQVVARRTLPGKGLYVSAEVGAGLRRYTRGFGAAELGLPLDEGLVEHALPRLATSSCWLVLPADACRGGDPARLRTRLAEVGVKVGERLGPILPLEPSFEALGLHLTEVVDEAGSNRVRELRSDCDGLLAPHLAAHCSEALALPELALEVGWEGAGRAGTTWLRGLPRPLRLELQGAQELASRLGVAPSTPGLAFDLAVPEAWGLAVGQSLLLKLAGQGLPARVQSLYRCPPSSPCGAFAEPMAVFRAQNLQAGLVRVHAVEPLALVPSYDGQDFDELLAYVPSVEQLEAVAGGGGGGEEGGGWAFPPPPPPPPPATPCSTTRPRSTDCAARTSAWPPCSASRWRSRRSSCCSRSRPSRASTWSGGAARSPSSWCSASRVASCGRSWWSSRCSSPSSLRSVPLASRRCSAGRHAPFCAGPRGAIGRARIFW